MKKKWIGILLGLLLCGGLVGGILWIIGIEEKEPVDPPSISDVGIVYEDE